MFAVVVNFYYNVRILISREHITTNRDRLGISRGGSGGGNGAPYSASSQY